MDPGFYQIPADQYFAIDAVSNSILRRFKQSPAAVHLPLEETANMRLGTAVHDLFLEPSEFEKRWLILPQATRTSQAAKEAILREQRGMGRRVLTSREHETVNAMAQSLRDNPELKELMEDKPHIEETVIWRRNDTLAKGRMDVCSDHFIIDLKTTSGITTIDRAAFNYGYFHQAAWYLDGCLSNGRKIDRFFLAWVSTAPPFETVVTLLDTDSIMAAAVEQEKLFHNYIECKKKRKWPQNLPPRTLSLPAWYLQKHLESALDELEEVL